MMDGAGRMKGTGWVTRMALRWRYLRDTACTDRRLEMAGAGYVLFVQVVTIARVTGSVQTSPQTGREREASTSI